MPGNRAMSAAKARRDDEFYTLEGDVGKAAAFFAERFRGRTVFCCCDDPARSRFVSFFAREFEALGLAALHASWLGCDRLWRMDRTGIRTIPMSGNGDFMSRAAREIMGVPGTIVATNPPYSLFGRFIDILLDTGAGFLVLGPCSALSSPRLFGAIVSGRAHVGPGCVRRFMTPRGDLFESARSLWYSSFPAPKPDFVPEAAYDPAGHREYDNYLAIDSDCRHIPRDWDGVVGVPLTFLERHDGKTFEVIGADFQHATGILGGIMKPGWKGRFDRAYMDGKRMYSRMFIRRVR